MFWIFGLLLLGFASCGEIKGKTIGKAQFPPKLNNYVIILKSAKI